MERSILPRLTRASADAPHSALPTNRHVLGIKHDLVVHPAHEVHEERHGKAVLAVLEVEIEQLVDLVDPLEVGVAVDVERLCCLCRTSRVFHRTTGGLEISGPVVVVVESHGYHTLVEHRVHLPKGAR